MASDPTHELLAELGWLRNLAARLVRDPAAADDLVQDACGLALTRPEPPRNWRAWLASVLPSLARDRRAADAARARREAARAERPEDQDTADLVARAEAQQRLGNAVLRLDEPYRSVVLLRFFDGLPPRRIARQLGVPVATVHSRLHRALQQLRTRLDADFGGRQPWLAAIAPLASFPQFLPTLVGTLAMQTKIKVLAAATAAVACSAPLWWPTTSQAADPQPIVANPGEAPPRGGSAGEASGSSCNAGRTERSGLVSPTPSTTPPRAATPTSTVTGRVCDCRGQALADVPLGIAGSNDERTRSGADGSFALALAGDHADLIAVGTRFVTVLAGNWTPTATIPPVVVVAEAIAVGGRVVDENGAPVPASSLLLQLPDDFETRMPLRLDRTGRERQATRSGDDGTFSFARLPRIDGASLLATADAFAPSTVPLPTGNDANVAIVLRRFHFADGELRGRVVDAGSTPVAGARVAMGVTSVASAADGTFTLSLVRAGWPTAIVAAKAGHRPGRLEIPANGGTKAADWPGEIVLRLGPAPRSVRGRVVDQDGAAIAKAEVWIDDPTPLGIAAVLPLQAEYLIAGGAVPPQAARMRVPHADEPTRADNFMDQTSDNATPSACWYFVITDEQGTFELGGLLDRSYRLKALDPASGLFGEASDVVGETYHTITIVRDVWPEVRGRVVSLRGEPIAGVKVDQNVVAWKNRTRVPGGQFEGTARRKGKSATTGADGTFVLRDVGKRFVGFALTGDAIVPTDKRGSDVVDPLQCTWVVEARCHVEVVLADANEADEVACVDANGEPLDLAVLRHNSTNFLTSLPLHDGRSGQFVVGERAAKLVLLRGERPVRSIPFTPDPKRVTTLQ
ncbi:MAG: sigma-70 family RNA polymerase sigma factor [Planctomycetes bacterium]|nr:sigma-70 family RNA polymerase sigma factor [Planctomycetota bacterium]